ncbi:MAG: YggS family pyridoxal phosphate-dependent enzyme [Bacteroidota bacterium]|jgi:pyridoxal phosphate enzyme (YggS family)|nr:MAG: YggS family pyridoxal phosphate-dependent enzyme [Bacteroidota bacterium]
MNVEKNISQLTRSLPAGCRLVAVSKTHGVDKIMAAYNAGQRIFGENRVQEMVEKQPQLPADIDWHLIGHLQRNKVKYIADFVALIHSVDSIKLLQEINRQGERVSRVIPCLIQVHIAREETKFGFSAEEIPTVITSEEIAGFRFVEIRGLMGMATLTDDTDQIRREFRGLRELFDRVKTMKTPPNVRFTELSMGMSSDYQIAIEEGSTLVRIGSAIFGERS